MISVSDRVGNFLKLNPLWEEVLGYSLDEMLSSQYTDFIPPDDRELSAKKISELEEGLDQRVSYENRYLCKDGSYKWLSWKCTLKDGLVYASARDITELKLHQLEFEKLQVSGRIGSWSVDFATMNARWSDEVYRIHDLEVGGPVPVDKEVDYYHPDDCPRIQAYLEKCTEDGTTFDDTFNLISEKGVENRVRSVGNPIIERGKVVGLYGTFQDISEEHKRNEAFNDVTTRMKLAIDSIGIGIWDWDVVNNVLVWDDRMYEVFQVKKDEFSGAYEAWRIGLY